MRRYDIYFITYRLFIYKKYILFGVWPTLGEIHNYFRCNKYSRNWTYICITDKLLLEGYP